MTGFGEYETALKGRDVIVKLIERVVDRIRPDVRIGEVITKDTNSMTCEVLLPGDTVALKARYHRGQEPDRIRSGTEEAPVLGDIVRLAGRSGNYYIFGILSPALPTDSGWIEPTFQNSWENYGAPYSEAAYRKIGNRVHLRGLVKLGVVGNSIFILPEGFRPPSRGLYTAIVNSIIEVTGAASTGTAHTHPVVLNDVATRIEISTDGTLWLTPSGGNQNGYVSLEGISFLVD